MVNSITYNGYNSFLDYGLTIKDMDLGQPEQVVIEQTVPYMDGSWDFSFLNGRPVYRKRNITITFNIIGENENDVYRKKCEVVRWLMSSRGNALEIDCLRDFVFQNVTARIDTKSFIMKSRRAAELTVVFKTDPYITSTTLRRYEFYISPSQYGTKCTVICDSETGTLPKITVSGTGTGSMRLDYKDNTYYIPIGSSDLIVDGLEFEIGKNTFVLYGLGKVIFKFGEEAI